MPANDIRYINPDPAANVLVVGTDVAGERVQVTALPASADGITRGTPDIPLESQDRPAAATLELILLEVQQMRLLLESVVGSNGD